LTTGIRLATGGTSVEANFSERVTQIAPFGIFEIARLAREHSGAIYLNLGEPDFATPAPVCEAARRAIDDGFTHYTHDAGMPELRQAIARKLTAFNQIRADPEQDIHVTAGSQEALFVTLATLIQPGDEVVITDPHYPHYYIDTLLHGGVPVLLPLREEEGYQVDPAALQSSDVTIYRPSRPIGFRGFERRIVSHPA
jgi:aspartate/methionine/tyrosine aminotransferase